MNGAITVSVLLIAYNHIEYIEQALRSAQMQQGAGSIEIIAHDDCSTDGTREFILEASARDPRIRPVLAVRNLASNAVVRRPLEMARGRYISVLDADDYWTEENRLARQVRILDADRSLAGCFHNAWVICPGGKTAQRLWTDPGQRRRTGRREIWEGNPFATAAGMLRRDALRDVRADWYDSFFLTDWPLYVAAAMQGDLLFVNEPVAAYRLHQSSSFTSRSFEERLERIADFYRHTACGLAAHGAAEEMARGAGLYFGELSRHHLDRGEMREALACLWHTAFTGSARCSIGWTDWIRLLRRAMMPGPVA